MIALPLGRGVGVLLQFCEALLLPCRLYIENYCSEVY
ncbi:hypothetical protein APH_1304 [Anaplasma phagocytophilum str. HZ]|uniref:Uncharacterized protein n=1 Tax=Anaplasma phagocytophilum (strain HZ) TaxID=212042 RepID=Q2GII3_ANAPZ|nr:hypothetical protein APH_1304 [Anaplasma phagocytophilum str. HZ]